MVDHHLIVNAPSSMFAYSTLSFNLTYAPLRTQTVNTGVEGLVTKCIDFSDGTTKALLEPT